MMYIKYYMYIMQIMYMKKEIVKVRERQGTSSLELTIPAKIRNEHNISGGDLFKVESFEKRGKVKIVYSLIYKNE